MGNEKDDFETMQSVAAKKRGLPLQGIEGRGVKSALRKRRLGRKNRKAIKNRISLKFIISAKSHTPRKNRPHHKAY